MTDINNLTKNVIDREQAKFNQSIAEFEEQTKAETEKEKQKLKQEFVARKANIEKDFKRQSDISRNSVQLRKRDKILGVKRELINQYIKDVELSLANLDQATTIKFVSAVLRQYNPEGNTFVTFGAKTKEVLGEKLQEAVGNFRVSDETIAEEHGFVIQEDSLQYNYIFSNLVNNSKEKLEALVVNNVLNK